MNETESDISAEFKTIVAQVEAILDNVRAAYHAAVQKVADKYGVYVATGHMSDFW